MLPCLNICGKLKIELLRIEIKLGKSGKVFGIKMARNPLLLEGNYNFTCW